MSDKIITKEFCVKVLEILHEKMITLMALEITSVTEDELEIVLSHCWGDFLKLILQAHIDANQRKIDNEEIIRTEKKNSNVKEGDDLDHRLTLRLPKWLLEKIDLKRNQRVGSISRNLWILEKIEESCVQIESKKRGEEDEMFNM